MSPALAGRFFTTSTTWEAPQRAHNYKNLLGGVYVCVCVCVCIFMTTGWFRPVQEVGNIVGFENNVKIYSANSL